MRVQEKNLSAFTAYFYCISACTCTGALYHIINNKKKTDVMNLPTHQTLPAVVLGLTCEMVAEH